MIVPESEIIFLDELATKYSRTEKDLLSNAIRGELSLYSTINSIGLATWYKYIFDKNRKPVMSGKLDKSLKSRFTCIYKLEPNELLSLRGNKELKTTIELYLNQNSNLRHFYENNERILNFKSTLEAWHIFQAHVEISKESLFVYNYELSNSVPIDIDELITAELDHNTPPKMIALKIHDTFGTKYKYADVADKLGFFQDCERRRRGNNMCKLISKLKIDRQEQNS